MESLDLTYIGATLLATIVSIAIGMIWYSSYMFGGIWMRGVNLTSEDLDRRKEGKMKYLYAINAVSTLLVAYIIAMILRVVFETPPLSVALQAVSILWFGFFAMPTAGVVVWEGKPWSIFFINAFYQLVSVLAIATILTIFNS